MPQGHLVNVIKFRTILLWRYTRNPFRKLAIVLGLSVLVWVVGNALTDVAFGYLNSLLYAALIFVGLQVISILLNIAGVYWLARYYDVTMSLADNAFQAKFWMAPGWLDWTHEQFIDWCIKNGLIEVKVIHDNPPRRKRKRTKH